MDETLYIRTDANSQLGIGHVMRCKTIADEWLKRGGNCIFLVADEESAHVIQQMGGAFICLHSRWDNLEYETKTLLDCIATHAIKRILIDSYYVTPKYLSSISLHSKIIYMGLMDEKIRPVDMIINYNITAETKWYHSVYGENVVKLLGYKFFPLRPEFKNTHIQIHQHVKNLLVTTGGSDSCHMALQLSKLLLEHTDLGIHVVIGAFNPDKNHLEQLQEENSRLQIYQNVKNMAKLMEQCDIAITAGGITLYELCACNLPSITYAFADNQLASIKEFQKQGIMESIGDIRIQTAGAWQNSLIAILTDMCKKDKKRKKIAAKMKNMIDGDGAKRIVEQILQYC